MLNVNLVCVGGVKEKFYADAQSEFVKRLAKFCSIKIIEVKTAPTTSISIEKQIDIECDNISNACKGYVCCFDKRGSELSSEDLAKMLDKLSSSGISEITFVIGGSYGMSEKFLASCEKCVSFGKITLPHALARIVALEQIYRAFTILSGIAYHK